MNLEQAEAAWAVKVGREFWDHQTHCPNCSWAIDWSPGQPELTITPRVVPCEEGKEILKKLHNPFPKPNET